METFTELFGSLLFLYITASTALPSTDSCCN
jgi:hypothetical protein